MEKKPVVWMALISLVLFSIACNLFGSIASDAIEDVVNEELIENFDEVVEDFSDGDWTRSDIPLPPDADIYGASEGVTEGDLVLLDTSMSLEEAETWMIEKLKDNGWSHGDIEMNIGQTRLYEFSKGEEGLSLVLNGNQDTGGTSISITVFPLE